MQLKPGVRHTIVKPTRKKPNKYKELLGRITGFSVPVFGVSWNPSESEVASARKVLAFLEDRRVLYNPPHVEVREECTYSVTEIRKFLTEVIGQLAGDSNLAAHLRAIRVACRAFLDRMHSQGRGVIHRGWEDRPVEASLFIALGELRSSIGLHVAAIALAHGIEVENQLASILPEEVNEGDV